MQMFPLSEPKTTVVTTRRDCPRHLLTHTSGLGDYPESFSLHRDYIEDELLKMITAQPLAFAPGDKIPDTIPDPARGEGASAHHPSYTARPFWAGGAD